MPPASVPLSFLALAGAGMWAFGLGAWFGADRIIESPTHPGAVGAVHVGMLAFLTTAVLGAVHQFAPVVGRRALRSVLAARITLVTMAITAWALPSGFAHGPERLIQLGAISGSITVLLAAWNLSGALASKDGGVPVAGLRLSIIYLVITVAFGAVYAFDRQAGWFPLLPNRVLAHAHIGLLGWLGLTYVAVAEKLWPMFLLAHRPHEWEGKWAVRLLASGVPFIAVGLLFEIKALAWIGGIAAIAGLGCHIASLASAIKHRRRALELLHGFLFVSTAFLIAGIVLAVAAGLADVDYTTRSRLVSGEVAALAAWLGLAIVGHAHKIVPFISYTSLRAKGVRTGPSGKPLMFGDLFNLSLAKATLALSAGGFTLSLVGILAASTVLLSIGGAAIAVGAMVVTYNLAGGPRRATQAARTASTSPQPTPSNIPAHLIPKGVPQP
ncbi:MAG: hypothetical protein KDA95_00910 [Acidimicrobiales bacterium]|nr:hypothetical protein [Acidimicrobiales bacterium]